MIKMIGYVLLLIIAFFGVAIGSWLSDRASQYRENRRLFKPLRDTKKSKIS